MVGQITELDPKPSSSFTWEPPRHRIYESPRESWRAYLVPASEVPLEHESDHSDQNQGAKPKKHSDKGRHKSHTYVSSSL